MPIWQDATVNVSTGVIDLSSGPDAVRVLAPQFVLAGNTARVGFGVDIIMGGGGGELLPAPAAPTLTLTSGATDNQPDFLVTGSDLLVDDVVTISAFSDVGLTTLVDTGIGTVTVANTLTVTNQLGPLSDGSYYYTAVTARTGHSTSAASNTETNTIDATAPTLSSPTGTKTGETTATIQITTNEANGTYYYVVDTNTTTPSAAQVKAGQDQGGVAADKSGSAVVSATGAQTAVNLTGLTAATTYKAYFMHEDAAGNQSTVSASATFTTDAASFTDPSDLANLIGWYKSDTQIYTDAGTTLCSSDGDRILQWNDLSGVGPNLTNGAGDLRPTFKTGILNGHPVVRCDGSAHQHMHSTASEFALGGTTVSVYMVVMASAADNEFGRFLCFLANGQANDYDNASSFLINHNHTTDFAGAYRDPASSSGAIVDGTYYQLWGVWDGTNETLYINGVAQTPAASTGAFAATGQLVLGAFRNNAINPAASLSGDIVEVVITSNADATDRANMDTYFNTRYGGGL